MMLNPYNKPQQSKKQPRRRRSDKGEIRATPRDLACIQWIAEMYAANGDHIRRLLSRYPDPDHPPAGKLVSPSTVREQISRWRRAGWIVYRRVLAMGPGWAYVSKRGLQLVDLDGVFLAKAPSTKRLEHIYAVNQMRLWFDAKFGYQWESERLYVADLELKRGESPGPIPDAIIYPNGKRTALEVQISELKEREWDRKLHALLNAYRQTPGSYGYEQSFPSIWIYVPTQEMKDAVQRSLAKCDEEDQARVGVAVNTNLVIPDAWAEETKKRGKAVKQ